MKLLTSIIIISLATTASAHCWPCNGKGEFTTDTAAFGGSNIRITRLGRCVRCCNYIIKNGYQSDAPFSENVFNHRDHCKEVHCQDWQEETGGTCDPQTYISKVDGSEVERPFCPAEHRCACQGVVGKGGCVGGDTGWDGDYGCTKAPCHDPAISKDTTW